MKRIILLVGIPGSGKSTLAKLLKERGYDCICADDIRLELYGTEAEQGDPIKVFEIFFNRLEKLLDLGGAIVVDNTNLKFEYRKEITDRARARDYSDIQIWVMDVPLQTCLERNRNRERQTEEPIVEQMFAQFERNGKPQRKEGKVVLVRQGSGKDDYKFI